VGVLEGAFDDAGVGTEFVADGPADGEDVGPLEAFVNVGDAVAPDVGDAVAPGVGAVEGFAVGVGVALFVEDGEERESGTPGTPVPPPEQAQSTAVSPRTPRASARRFKIPSTKFKRLPTEL
jgi:hypothetical protein